jgi:hypothetical protein
VQVLLMGFAVDQNVIEEDYHKNPKLRRQGWVHGPLECTCTRGSRQSKRYHSKLIVSSVCWKRCFKLLIWLQPYLMIPWMEINNREPGCWAQLIN